MRNGENLFVMYERAANGLWSDWSSTIEIGRVRTNGSLVSQRSRSIQEQIRVSNQFMILYEF